MWSDGVKTVTIAAGYEASPPNGPSLIAQVDSFLAGDAAQVQEVFNSAMREISAPPNASPVPRATLADATTDQKLDFYQRWEHFRPYLTELAGVQEDPWNIANTTILESWSSMWGEEDAQFNAVRIALYVSGARSFEDPI